MSNATASFHKPTTANQSNGLHNKHAQLDMMVSDQQALNKQHLGSCSNSFTNVQSMVGTSTLEDDKNHSKLYKSCVFSNPSGIKSLRRLVKKMHGSRFAMPFSEAEGGETLT